MASRQQLLQTYRTISKKALRACQYAKPERFDLRDGIRYAFRQGKPADFNPVRIQNTLEFLDGAAREKGLEHKIVKNLAFIWFHQRARSITSVMKVDPKKRQETEDLYFEVTGGFDHTIHLLNESMDLCIPTRPWPLPGHSRG